MITLVFTFACVYAPLKEPEAWGFPELQSFVADNYELEIVIGYLDLYRLTRHLEAASAE